MGNRRSAVVWVIGLGGEKGCSHEGGRTTTACLDDYERLLAETAYVAQHV